MVNIVCFTYDASKFLQQVILFVGGAVRSDDSDSFPALHVPNLHKALSDQFESFFPGRWSESPILTDKRLLQTLFVISKIKGITALDAKEVPVDSALVTIIAADDLHPALGPPYTQSGLATIGAVRARRPYMLHFPRACPVAIRSGCQCTHRTNIDAHAALFALQVIFLIRGNNRAHPAVLNAQSPNVHGLTAHPH